MPPRHAYWTILVDDQPTAFRAHDPEELLPTLNRLREKNASAVMKWFERGQLFESRDAARDAGFGRGERRWEGPRPERGGREERGERDPGEARARSQDDRPRDKSWRPGGEHRDPRQKYLDAKKAKWNRFKEKIREGHERRQPRDEFAPDTFSPPHGDPLRDEIRPSRATSRPAQAPHPQREAWRDDRQGQPSRPHGDKRRSRPPRKEWRQDARDHNRDRAEWHDRDRDSGKKKPFGSAPAARKPWGSKPGASGGRKPWGAKPAGAGARKPWGAKPAGAGDRKPWGARPAGAGDRKPWGAKPTGAGERKPWGGKPMGAGERRPWGGKSAGGAKRAWGPKPSTGAARKPWTAKPRRRRDDDETS